MNSTSAKCHIYKEVSNKDLEKDHWDDLCVICQKELFNGHKVKPLLAHHQNGEDKLWHALHKKCLKLWILASVGREASCPKCCQLVDRTTIVTPEEITQAQAKLLEDFIKEFYLNGESIRNTSYAILKKFKVSLSTASINSIFQQFDSSTELFGQRRKKLAFELIVECFIKGNDADTTLEIVRNKFDLASDDDLNSYISLEYKKMELDKEYVAKRVHTIDSKNKRIMTLALLTGYVTSNLFTEPGWPCAALGMVAITGSYELARRTRIVELLPWGTDLILTVLFYTYAYGAILDEVQSNLTFQSKEILKMGGVFIGLTAYSFSVDLINRCSLLSDQPIFDSILRHKSQILGVIGGICGAIVPQCFRAYNTQNNPH